MKILDTMWFCAGHGNVGIVRLEDPYEGIKYYIGQCSGSDEALDQQHIADWGSSFPKEAGDMLFGVSVLDKLQDGRAVVVPKDQEHAEAMVRMGMFYLDQHNVRVD